MNDQPQDTSNQLSEEEANQMLRSLLHKEGTWVDWGKTCHQLQQAGYNSQTLFEQTGFQASQQNLIIVAAQVYESLVISEVSEDLLSYYRGPKSDVLYELRILNQEQRAIVAQLAKDKGLDYLDTKEVAKTFQTFSRLPQLPPNFTLHPGDAIAYQCWKQGKQKKDLQDRTRLIAKGLKFAHSMTAREAIEKLLTDFTAIPQRSAPLMPLYRLEEQQEMSCIVPLVGTLPLSKNEVEGVRPLDKVGPFNSVSYSGKGSIVPLPGWQAVLKSVNPVAIFTPSDRLPQSIPGKPEEVLVLIDLAITDWDDNSYFLVEDEGELTFKWFSEQPSIPLLGQVVIVLRPKKIFDENNLLEAWQMDD
ncbi:RuBisCO accumulation factor 1 [Crocosphaera sp. XPORK-15E]|uniref:RuBisCO accumulation factor 1 n=1 Tax=Crocosphaera sp. XPORK-15E TaxID=3110247 RepID=UPI002B2130B3|nr:RuBisCO accumulation factor 1 [Crocosphaera sp. XPORK-15E]MEA5535768.1 RuBisCO accumulation factor 1 [Crocosphaera sp. XPORK-15E]